MRKGKEKAEPGWGRGIRQEVCCLSMTVLLLLLAVAPARAADLPTNFEQANKLYEEGKFAAAADAYNALVESGSASTAIYFNRGNAFFKLGQIGRAIASYRL